MTHTDDDLESAYSVHIGFESAKDKEPPTIPPQDWTTKVEGSNGAQGDKKAESGSMGLPAALTIVKQPNPTPLPSTIPSNDAPHIAPRRPTHLRLWSRIVRAFLMILSALGYVFIILGAGIGVVVLVVVIGCVPLAFAVAHCCAMVVIGNAILNKAGLVGYTFDHGKAAAVGAVGGIFAPMIVGFVASFWPKVGYNGEEPQHPWYIRMASTVLAGTLSGTIGCAILLRSSVDLHGLDVLHATRAGALGGAIFGPGSIFILPAILLVIGIILSPLWLALSLGLRFMYSKSRESWTGNSHSYSFCYCYGTCGDDPEIQSEINYLENMRR